MTHTISHADADTDAVLSTGPTEKHRGPDARQPGIDLARVFGNTVLERRLQLLRQIGACHSISQAARDAKVSYKLAWLDISGLERDAGVALIAKKVGGVGGGSTHLTPAGRTLLEVAQHMASACQQVLQGSESLSRAADCVPARA